MWKPKRTKRFYRPIFAGGMALALFTVVPSARGQQSPDQSQQDQSQQRSQGDQQRDRDNPNPDLRRQQLAEMDQFLDKHPEVDAQLKKQPDLILNQTYLSQHPDLQTFLNDHPQVKEEFRENPNYFMYRENRYDAAAGSRQANPDANRDRDSDRRDVAEFDRFLDSHRETAQQLRKQPDLVLNDGFLKSHPALQEYLQQHPAIRDQIRQNPNAFMAQEAQFEQRGDNDANHDRGRDTDRRDATNPDQRGDNDANRDRDRSTDRRDAANSDQRGDNDAYRDRDRSTYRRDVANFDQFLDRHHETAEQLRRDPSQINNDEFVKSHPALQAYLQQHPGVRQEVSQNPNAFMQQEARYDRNDNGMDRYDSSRRQFGQFLGGHSDVARQLSENPSLAKNHEYMDNHPELRDYLNSHPDVQKQLTADPDNFVKSAQQFNTTTTSGQTTKTPMPDASKPKQ